jgi:hypothetical protein
MMPTVLEILMTNDDDCPNDDDDDDPAGGGQGLEDDWMGYLLTNDADCTKY